MAKVKAFESSGPGKFDCRADERVYRLSLSGCDAAVGESDGFGWYGLLRGPIFGLAKAGAIISENSQGFVAVTYHDEPDGLEAEWSEIEAEAESWSKDHEEA